MTVPRRTRAALHPDLGLTGELFETPVKPSSQRATQNPALRALMLVRRLLLWPLRWTWDKFCRAVALEVEVHRRAHRPKHIYLIRHGQSLGNVDESLYSSIPDHAMEISDLGREQARAAGRFLGDRIGRKARVHCFASPYLRAGQTLVEILAGGGFDREKFTIREDPALREQEFGNFQDVDVIRRSKEQRRRYGRFWFRFDNGESGGDVHGRAAAFLLTLFRQMDLSQAKRSRHYIILAHGLFIRLLCMRYFGWTVPKFEQVWNPGNCEIWRLDKEPDGRYYLAQAYEPRRNETTGELEMQECILRYGPCRGLEIPEEMRIPWLRSTGAYEVDTEADEVRRGLGRFGPSWEI